MDNLKIHNVFASGLGRSGFLCGSYSGIFPLSSLIFASLAFNWARDSRLGLVFLVGFSVVISEEIAAVKFVGRKIDVVFAAYLNKKNKSLTLLNS